MFTEIKAWRLADAIMQGRPQVTSRVDAYGFALQILVVLDQAMRDGWELHRCNPGRTIFLSFPYTHAFDEIVEAYSQGIEVGALPPDSTEILVFRPDGWPM